MDTNVDLKTEFEKRSKALGIKVGGPLPNNNKENEHKKFSSRFLSIRAPLNNQVRSVFQQLGSYVILAYTSNSIDVYFSDSRHAAMAFSRFGGARACAFLPVDDTVVKALGRVGVRVHEGPVTCKPQEYNWYALVGEVRMVDTCPDTGDLKLEYYLSTRAYEALRMDTDLMKQSSTSRKEAQREKNIVTTAVVPRKNTIDLNRVANGLDTRTTLMIRNIPNKFTQKMLQDWVDETSRGTYDFLYLRMDFRNRCNVGYAFISFVSPNHIIKFANERCSKKWGSTQGKECLIEKFRNSSVMDQGESYRPLLFHTDGPLAGQPQEFPAPNSINRKMRSIANLRQIGILDH
ncbi:Meiosis protein [Yarrowia sp. C11]|nr:Meiosis protein [Yarrowia sp. E02]KAG5371553.1 Meiosis protein [Yarrowia sp. C11]